MPFLLSRRDKSHRAQAGKNIRFSQTLQGKGPLLTSIHWLQLSLLGTALMWLPYTANALTTRGLWKLLSYPDDPPPLSAWAQRAKRAHWNSIENLALFCPAVLAHGIVTGSFGVGRFSTAAMVFFVSRMLHFATYTAGIPVARTFSFAIGWGATGYLLVETLRIVC